MIMSAIRDRVEERAAAPKGTQLSDELPFRQVALVLSNDPTQWKGATPACLLRVESEAADNRPPASEGMVQEVTFTFTATSVSPNENSFSSEVAMGKAFELREAARKALLGWAPGEHMEPIRLSSGKPESNERLIVWRDTFRVMYNLDAQDDYYTGFFAE